MVANLIPITAVASQMIGTPSENNPEASRFTIGTAGHQVTALRWWRYNTTHARPTNLQLWDVAGPTLLLDVATGINDTVQVGWQTQEISPFTLLQGTTYQVQYHMGTNGAIGGHSTPATAESPLQFTGRYNMFQAGSNVLATSAQAGQAFISVEIDGGAGTVPPATPADVDEKLSDWLSTNANLHQTDGLPWLSRVDLQTLLANLGNVTQQDVITYGLTGRQIGAAISWLLANVANVLNAAEAIHRWLGGNGGAPSDYDYHGAIEDIRQKVYDNETLGHELYDATLGRGPLEGAEWLPGATFDFAEPFTFDVGADLYVCTFTSTPPALPIENVASVAFARRLGWWSPRRGGSYGQRSYLDFLGNTLTWHAGWMDGCVVSFRQPASGTIQAFSRVP